MIVTFDANILIYAVDTTAGHKHHASVDLLRRAAAVDCFLTLQTLGEFLNVVPRKTALPLSSAQHFVASWRILFPIRAAVERDIDNAIWAATHHQLSYWDAMLWATTDAAGCDLLLTEDMHDGQRVGRVTFVNPFNPANKPLLDRALPI